MLAAETSRTKRVNFVMSEALVEWASSTAEVRGISMSALVREALERERERLQEEAIENAAALLAPMYSTDPELTAFTALDAEDFA